MYLSFSNRGLIWNLYVFAYKTWQYFKGRSFPQLPKQQTNFCTVTRTIFIYLPLALLVNLTVVGLIGWELYTLGYIIYVHSSSALLVVGGLLGFIGIVLLGAVLVKLFARGVVATAQTEPVRFVTTWVKSKKEQVCPFIEFK